MASEGEVGMQARRLAPDAVAELIDRLRDQGFTVLGPTRRGSAIVIDELESATELPKGVGDEQRPGHYRLRTRADQALFGYAVGPTSFRRWFHTPSEPLVHLRRKGASFEAETILPKKERLALLGARACDLHALHIQDRVFNDGEPDEHYAARRRDVFIVAVQCTTEAVAETCFCASMNSGPSTSSVSFDVSLTEMVDGGDHWFLAEAGSREGRALLDAVTGQDASPEEVGRAGVEIQRAADKQTRRIDPLKTRAALLEAARHPRWDEIATRCLACTSCTLACPTCFCSTMSDETNLTGDEATRTRRWSSCFETEHSYLHGGAVRTSVAAKYRQWMTHKLATWHDQFNTPGCVGCGRCTTWCPAAIDFVEEANTIVTALVEKES